jgi:hypothetical protein
VITYLHVIEDFLESENHATPDDHHIHLVQEMINQFDLVTHFGPGKEKKIGNRSDRPENGSSPSVLRGNPIEHTTGSVLRTLKIPTHQEWPREDD